MGATFMVETRPGDTAEDALAAFKRDHAAEFPGDPDRGLEPWDDPITKPGPVTVWGEPVAECAVEWMIGWSRENPPPGLDPWDKWGPWMTFQRNDGQWVLFGWVNT